MKRRLIVLALALCLVLGLAACGGNNTANNGAANNSTAGNNTADNASDSGDTADGKVITVGATPAPHAEILEVAKEVLAEEGYTLDIVEFDDYIMPNDAVEEGELDANYFQHITYMNQFNEDNGYHLVSVGSIHYEPFGLYAGKTASIEELADGAQVAIPNDATNGGRALLLLEQEGLITLKEGAGITATVNDIVDNLKNLEIVELEARLLLHDLAAVSSKQQYALAEMRLQGYTIAEIALAQGMPKIRIRRLLKELYRAYLQLYMGGGDAACAEEKG